MAKQPAFMFYTGDWLKDPSLRAASSGARGLWIDMLALMWETQPRGYLQTPTGTPLTDEQIARMTGNCSLDEVCGWIGELESLGVFSRTSSGVIYSRRLVRDERKREKCREAGKRGGNPLLVSRSTLKGQVKGEVKGARKGRSKRKLTPSSSSSISISDPSSSSCVSASADSPSGARANPPSGGDDDGPSGNWEEVTAQLTAIGIRDVAGAIHNAKQQKLSASDVTDLIAVYRQHGGWNPKILHWRISHGVPTQAPDDGWPPPDATVANRESRNRAHAQVAAETAAYRIIRDGRRARRSDDAIKAELEKAGLEWPA